MARPNVPLPDQRERRQERRLKKVSSIHRWALFKVPASRPRWLVLELYDPQDKRLNRRMPFADMGTALAKAGAERRAFSHCQRDTAAR